MFLRKIRCGSQRPLRPADWNSNGWACVFQHSWETQSSPNQPSWFDMWWLWRSLASAAQSDEHPAQGVGASCYTEVEEIELSVLPLAGTGFWCSQKPHSATKRFQRQQALWFSEFSVLAAPLSSWAGLPIDSCRFRHDKTRTRDRICGMPKKTIVTLYKFKHYMWGNNETRTFDIMLVVSESCSGLWSAKQKNTHLLEQSKCAWTIGKLPKELANQKKFEAWLTVIVFP